MDIKNVLILGAGTMGSQIGLQCAAFGFNVTIFDPFEEALETAKVRVGKLAGKMAAAGRITQEQADGAPDRVSYTTDPGAAGKDADFISESVPEDPELKKKVFSQFNDICPEHTIFTTNTSTLVPSMFADGTGRAEKFCAFHFHDCLVTNVVDIMPHPGTSKETIESVRDFCTAIDQFPIELQREQHGYVFNTMLSDWMASALDLASNGVASVEDIDRAWMGIMRTHTGPFAIMDSVGISTVYKITDFWAKATKHPQKEKNAAFLKAYVDRGDLGIKTGKGFYSYPKPAFFDPDFLKGIH